MLQDLCSLFGVEFELTAQGNGGLVHVKKKAGVTHPFTLQYGRGKGLYKLSRANVNNAGITNRLYVYGSQENLPRNYGHTKLCLADTSRLTSYLEDKDSIDAYGVKEGEKNYPDIKAERVGVITALGADRITFIDTSGDPDDPENLPMFDLNEKAADGSTKYLIDGTSAKIKFQTGNLAGYEFELHSYDHGTKTFVINRFTDENGLIFPNDEQDAFTFAVGDKYIITDIQLPDSYVRQAQGRLEAAARADFPPMTQPQVSYKLGLTEGFFASIWGKEVETEFLHVGDYIHIVDKEIGVDKEVRITAITRDLLRPHSYELTLSDTVVKSSIVKVINDIQDIQDAISYNSGFTDPSKARRRWMATQELLNLVFDPEGDYYSEKIKPLSIETQMLSVGAKSTQFTLNNVTIQPNYNGDPNTIAFSDGLLVHYGIDPEHTRPWVMGATTFSGLNPNQPYYIYARCPREGGNGSWLINTQAIPCEAEAANYYFLVGVLNSISTDNHGGNRARLISLTYGSSTINGRFIRCGRIESSGGGATYFDLDTGVISGRILFRSSDGTIKEVSDLESKTQEIEDYINGTLQGTLEGIQGQLDGVIEQYFETVDPSPNQDAPLADPNEPASTWTTNEDKEKHAGDLYYNTESGKVWRYVKGRVIPRPGAVPGYRYFWRELQDTELAKALQLAQDAMNAADDKARIFYVTPYAPYDPGDLWVQGTTGDIMVCKTGRAADAVPNFATSDWEKASKYTDDSGLHDFILNQYASDMADLLNQVDGKIECFYTSANPANNWDETDYDRHIGDQWYNVSTKNLYRFVKAAWLNSASGWTKPIIPSTAVGKIDANNATYYWLKIENADAIAAAAAAAAAQDTADGKRTVFVTEPKAPYYVGDLWLKGIDSTGKASGGLWRCIKDNTTKGSFNTNDWVEATYYDCTQTAIDGGIVTAGTVQLANEHTGSIVAGITGGYGKTFKETASTPEEEKVRIWAGASESNRRTAPFRVLQNGKVYATNAEIEGKVTATDGSFTGTVNANAGRIGRLVIMGNDLAGLDDNGVERVRIGVGTLPSVNTAFSRVGISFSLSSSDGEASWPEDAGGYYTANVIGSGREISTNRDDGNYTDNAHVTAVVKFSLSQTARTVTFGRWDAGYRTSNASAGTVTAKGTATLYRVVGTARTKIGSWEIEEQSYDVDFDSLSPGNYEVHVTTYVEFSGEYWFGDVEFWIGGGIWIETAAQSTNITTIAKDGILTMHAADKYLFYSASQGFETRWGNYGLKVDSGGAQTLVNGKWVKIKT
ncbi:MAG: hypothetical protein J6C44_06335 [Muribaculaceae bacterium]|nr:hypothetical protein [Muribaculaceae bacterium]MBO5187483.1 hypothetical protein [Prevotella sp.]